jgi:DNA-binding response OmpR family regulator
VLAARVEALAQPRHTNRCASILQGGRYEAGPLVIDSNAYEARLEGRPLRLTPTEFKLLLALARRAPHAVAHEDLTAAVWGDDAPTRPDTLRLYISYLRRKLHAAGQASLVQGRRSAGYALVATAGQPVKGLQHA